MSNALHELTITLLKRGHEQELTKVKEERDGFMKKFMELKADYERTRIERLRLLRELHRICQQVDFSSEQLKDIDSIKPNKS